MDVIKNSMYLVAVTEDYRMDIEFPMKLCGSFNYNDMQ